MSVIMSVGGTCCLCLQGRINYPTGKNGTCCEDGRVVSFEAVSDPMGRLPWKALV
jgi:hypothetical protein